MVPLVISTFVDLFVFIFTILLVARAITSFVASPSNRFYVGLVMLTEPLVAPIRKVMPATPGLDLAPLIAFILLRGMQYLVHMILGV